MGRARSLAPTVLKNVIARNALTLCYASLRQRPRESRHDQYPVHSLLNPPASFTRDRHWAVLTPNEAPVRAVAVRAVDGASKPLEIAPAALYPALLPLVACKGKTGALAARLPLRLAWELMTHGARSTEPSP
jgi:hypothetical protein